MVLRTASANISFLVTLAGCVPCSCGSPMMIFSAKRKTAFTKIQLQRNIFHEFNSMVVQCQIVILKLKSFGKEFFFHFLHEFFMHCNISGLIIQPIVSQTVLHVDPQLKYTIFCRPRGLAQQLLIEGIVHRPAAYQPNNCQTATHALHYCL